MVANILMILQGLTGADLRDNHAMRDSEVINTRTSCVTLERTDPYCGDVTISVYSTQRMCLPQNFYKLKEPKIYMD